MHLTHTLENPHCSPYEPFFVSLRPLEKSVCEKSQAIRQVSNPLDFAARKSTILLFGVLLLQQHGYKRSKEGKEEKKKVSKCNREQGGRQQKHQPALVMAPLLLARCRPMGCPVRAETTLPAEPGRLLLRGRPVAERRVLDDDDET